MKEIETPERTPEQLLRTIALEAAAPRSQRGTARRNRAIILVAGVIFIVVAASVALLVLDQMLDDLRQRGTGAPTETTASSGNY